MRAWSALLGIALQARRCLYCGTARSLRAPTVELICAAAVAWMAGHAASASTFLTGLLVLAVFLLIAVIDIEHRVILHAVSGAAALAVGLVGVLDPARGAAKTLLGGLAGLGIVFGLFLIGEAFSRLVARARGRPLQEVAFGFGDVTLAGVIGLTVGWPGVVLALLLGILAAGAFSLLALAVMLARRRYVPFTAIPYGPFLILGALIVYFGGRAVFQPWLAR